MPTRLEMDSRSAMPMTLQFVGAFAPSSVFSAGRQKFGLQGNKERGRKEKLCQGTEPGSPHPAFTLTSCWVTSLDLIFPIRKLSRGCRIRAGVLYRGQRTVYDLWGPRAGKVEAAIRARSLVVAAGLPPQV